MDSTDINPYAAPSSEPSAVKVPTQGRVRLVFALACACLILLGCPVASWFANQDIESILASGPALGLTAVILILLARRDDLRRLQPIALAMLAIITLIFLTIFVQEWSPEEAQEPIGTASIYCAAGMQVGFLLVYWTLAGSDRSFQSTVEEQVDTTDNRLQ